MIFAWCSAAAIVLRTAAVVVVPGMCVTGFESDAVSGDKFLRLCTKLASCGDAFSSENSRNDWTACELNSSILIERTNNETKKRIRPIYIDGSATARELTRMDCLTLKMPESRIISFWSSLTDVL